MTQTARTESFGEIADAMRRTPSGKPDFARIQQSADFVRLRRRLRLFVFPMSALFFVWYLTYVLLAAYAHDFMSRELVGSINVGLVLGVLQFVSTIVIMVLYLRYARRRIDPLVERIRAEAGEPTR